MTLFHQRFMYLLLFCLLGTTVVAQKRTTFNIPNYTPNYSEIIDFYRDAAERKGSILLKMGESDGGNPIYLFLYNVPEDSAKALEFARANTVLLINNGIHAGEPDGINACMAMVDNLAKQPTTNRTVIAIIPAYNVDGVLNRSASSRANQNGPEEYGFRGNAKYLDLNRDFIKSDSKNALTFAKIFQAVDADVFVDTHVSNGANYQYTLTYINPMTERMPKALAELTNKHCIPFVKKELATLGIKTVPYVEMVSDTLEKGIHQFNDLPRYAMGYARLFHAISFTSETHMLKPFDQRVAQTLAFLNSLLHFANTEFAAIEKMRKQCKSEALLALKHDYKLSAAVDSICFLGFEAGYKKSEISGKNRLYYDENRPFERNIPFYGNYEAQQTTTVPRYFVIKKQEKDVIERLRINNIEFTVLKMDTTLNVQSQRIANFESYSKPYEGHFYHRKVSVTRVPETIGFEAGDILVNVRQERALFLANALLPEMEDSYFRWNFFDSYLSQKEGYSDYVFEDMAVQILSRNSELKKAFELKKLEDKQFGLDGDAQLDYIYKHSENFELNSYCLPIYEIK